MITHPKFACINVSDQERTLAFLTEKLGFTVSIDAPYGGDGGRWIEVRPPGSATALVVMRADDLEPGSMGSVWFQTDDLDATYEALSARGVEFTVAPQPAPWNPDERWAQFADPDGILYGLS